MTEMSGLEKNGTWEIVSRPKDKSLVGYRWLFSVKYNSDGSIERYKAHLVAKGYTQIPSIDFQDSFTPVAKINYVCILVSSY